MLPERLISGIMAPMPADPDLFDELLSFVLARHKDRRAKAEAGGDLAARQEADRWVKLTLDLASDVRRNPQKMGNGIQWLRERAARYPSHPAYRSEWRIAGPRDEETRGLHRWDPHKGTCSCRWEPSSDRGAEREHARHVERILRGLPR